MKNKTQKIMLSLITVLAAVLLITTTIFGVKWSETKSKLKDFKATLTLNIDSDNQDLKPEYTYTFTDYIAGKSLDEVLNNDLPKDCPFTFSISKGFLNSVTTKDKTITNKFGTKSGTSWMVYSSTSTQVADPTSKDKEKETSVGLNDLLMGPTNEFTFSYQNVSW